MAEKQLFLSMKEEGEEQGKRCLFQVPYSPALAKGV
jgi:hypothetical protein